MKLSDLAPALLDALVERIRATEDAIIGVAAFGSYVRGNASVKSDLDLVAISRIEPRLGYRTWFVEDLHVSIGFESLETLKRSLTEQSGWSLKLGVAMPAVWMWATESAHEELGDPPDFSRRPGPPELEDFVEYTAKALRAGDPLALRVAARGVGEEAPALLRDLNEAQPVSSRVDAVRVACGFSIAPDGWPHDLLILLGYAAAEEAEVRDAVVRVAAGVLRILRESRSTVGDGQPELTQYLLDGTLERHLGL